MFDELYKEGKVKHFGVSNFSKEAIEYISKKTKQKIEYNQLQFGLAYNSARNYFIAPRIEFRIFFLIFWIR